MSNSSKTLVLGDGGWGQALAMALHRAGRKVAVWGFDGTYAADVACSRDNKLFLPGVRIPEEIQWTGDVAEALDGAEEYFSVVPTQFLRPTLDRFDGKLALLPAISASKGLELGTLERPSEILKKAAGAQAGVAVLSGPSHAEEVSLGRTTTVVIASDQEGLAEHAQTLISNDSFRVYTSSDLVGVELGGALKNIIALGAGMVDALGLGDNAKAALVSRGLMEMARFGVSEGAQRETFFGLSGAGDLMVTCYSQHSRNRGLGERIGSGESLKDILESSAKVAEGVWTCKAIHAYAKIQGVKMPLTEAIFGILFEGQDPHKTVHALMTRPTRSELDTPTS
jgi:glycerol-3-phosphate dehydrogenase (NAD(P)+)